MIEATEGLLSREDFEFIIEQSKIKNDKIISDTSHIFTGLMEKMYPEDKEKQTEFIEGFYNKMREKIEARMADDLERRTYEKGVRILDPFFPCNYKCLLPAIKRLYFDCSISAKDIHYRYGSVAINEYLRNECGGLYDEFKRLLEENIEGHRKMLSMKNIRQMRDVKIKGISKTVVIDILVGMRAYKRRMKSI
jgi:hypothetical protein